MFGDSYNAFLNCSTTKWDLNTTALEQEGYDYTDSFTFVTLLVDNYGSIAKAMETLLAECFQEFTEIANFLKDTEAVMSYEPDSLKDILEGFEVSTTKYEVACVIGFFGGLLVAIYIAGVLIPSYISSVLKLRSGVIPTLKDRDFQRYREALDAVTVLVGSCFWGAFFSSAAAMAFTIQLVSYDFISNGHYYSHGLFTHSFPSSNSS